MKKSNFNKQILEDKMKNIREETYIKYKKFLEELPEYMIIDKDIDIAKHCKSESVSSNTYLVMQIHPIDLLVKRKVKGEQKFNYYINYSVKDDNFNIKARMLAAGCSLYGAGSKIDNIYVDDVNDKKEPELVISTTNDNDDDFIKKSKKIISKFKTKDEIRDEKAKTARKLQKLGTQSGKKELSKEVEEVQKRITEKKTAPSIIKNDEQDAIKEERILSDLFSGVVDESRELTALNTEIVNVVAIVANLTKTISFLEKVMLKETLPKIKINEENTFSIHIFGIPVFSFKKKIFTVHKRP